MYKITMCSRFALTASSDEVRHLFAHENEASYPPRYNIAPSQPIGIIRMSPIRTREFALVRWGFIPGWVKEPARFSTLINARAETVLEKPSFKNAMRHRRCLLPATCFYEWAGPKGGRRAYMIAPHTSSEQPAPLMAFAAIWEHWMSPDGTEMESAAILTTQANREVSHVHHRMPVILEAKNFESWLDCAHFPDRAAHELCRPAPDDFLQIQEISTLVNNYKNTGADIQIPLQGSLF